MSEIAGGQFRLTCGQIGAGKSYLYVKQVEEEVKKSGKYKKIYSNIRAHAELADGITPMPDDWEQCEEDSLIIFDEVQIHEKYSKHFSNRRDEGIARLTMIRHKRIDIWMISPNPALVNKDVRDLVNQYFWLEPVGKKATKCYCFSKVYLNITKSTKMQAYDEFVYTIEPKYHELYRSTIDGKPSGRTYNLNFKLIGFVAGLVVVVLIIMALAGFLFKGTKSKVDDMQKTENKNTKEQKADLGVLPQPTQLTSEECRKGINVDKPECIKYFNNLTENKLSVGSLTVSYDPSQPYEQDEIQEAVSKTYQVTAKPVFSGCMKKNGKYYAYTQQGTLLSVSNRDCERLINDGERPFNYFANNNNSVLNGTSNQVQPSSQVSEVSQVSMIRNEQYANNYVEPHLQAKTTNGANDQAGFNNNF